MIDEPLIAIEVRARDALELRSFCESVASQSGRDRRPYAQYFEQVVARFGAAIERAIKEGAVRDGSAHGASAVEHNGPRPGGPPGV